MNKTIFAAVVATGIVTLAGCAEEAKADVTVYGSIEQGVTSSGSVMDSTSGDNYIGFNATESFGEGAASAFAKIEMAYDGETDGLTNREAYVGLDLGSVAIQSGRMKNLEKTMVASAVDVFEGESFATAGSARVPNATAAIVDLDVATVGASVITDGANGEDKVDAYEVAAKVGTDAFSVAGVYTKDNANETIAKKVSATATVSGLTLGGAYDIDTEDKILTAQVEMGANTLRGGVDFDVDNEVGKKVVEAQHNFSKNTSVYANYSVADGEDSDITVAMRMKF
jgi:predicted porin